MIQAASATEKNLTAPMNAEEARALTDQINHAAGELWRLLLESYEREAWRALGYGSWREYATSEFSMSKSRAYQILDQGRMIAALSEELGSDSTIVEMGEGPMRALKGVPEERRAEVFQEASANGKPTAAAITEVARVRDQPPEPDPEPEYVEPTVDAHDEWEKAQKEVERLEDVIEALKAGDLETQVISWSAKYAQLEGRVMQLTTQMNEARRQAKYGTTLLGRIRKTLGVESDRDIIPAIERFRP